MQSHLFAAAAVTIALAAPALGIAAPAQSAADVQTISVSYGDINISTPAGHAVLVARVKQAAESICGQRPVTLLDVAANQRFNACMSKAVNAAMAKVPAPAMVAGSTRPNG